VAAALLDADPQRGGALAVPPAGAHQPGHHLLLRGEAGVVEHGRSVDRKATGGELQVAMAEERFAPPASKARPGPWGPGRRRPAARRPGAETGRTPPAPGPGP